MPELTPNFGWLIPSDPTNQPQVRAALIAVDADLFGIAPPGSVALADPGSNGIVVRTALGTTLARSLAAPGAGITIADPSGVAGNPTFALANDLAALEGLSGTGFAKRTAADTWTVGALVSSDVGLGNVDNTSDVNKPVSTAQQTALNLKANLAGPTFTGTVSIPSPFTLGGVSVLPTGTELNFVDGVTSAIQTQLDGKQPLDSDLTTIAGLTPTTNNFIVSVASAWASRTPAQVKTTLSLDLVENTALSTWAGSSNLTTVGQLAVSLIPAVTDTYDLGSSLKLWRKGWLSELDAVLFAQNTISVVGGWMMIAKGEGLVPVGQDVASGNTTIDFGQAMTANDLVIFRAAGAVEYVQVLTLSSGTRYNVTRNLDGSGANDWPAGSVYVILGNTTSGRIELNANSTPRISMIRQGATYNAQTELLRIGDLNGSWNVSSETYGFAVGQYGVSGKSSLAIDDSGIHFYNNTTERIRLLADGSAYFGNGNLAISVAGVLTASGWTIDSAAIQNSAATVKLRGAGNLAFGATPPVDAATGTGLFLDSTGMYGLASSVVQAKFDAVTGAITAGAGNIVMNAFGIQAISGASPAASRSYNNVATVDGTVLSTFFDVNEAGSHGTFILSNSVAAKDSDIQIGSSAPTGKDATVELRSTVNGVMAANLLLSSTGIDIGGNIVVAGDVTVGDDLFLAEGGVINWDNGDLTLTQAGDLLTLAGGNLALANMTAGSVLFAGGSGLVSQDNANLFWDDTNNRLGVGTAAPSYSIDVLAPEAFCRVQSSTGTNRAAFFVMNTGGSVIFGAEDSDGVGLFNTGTLGYAGVFGTTGARAVQLCTNQTARLTIDSSGKVGIGTNAPATSALLELSSTVGAFLPPRMTTTQRDALTAVDGMILYNSTTGALNYRKAGAWVAI